LVVPALPYLDSSREICIIPNKMLFKLPFAALLSPESKYFIEQFTFFYSPSSNVFILSTQKARERTWPGSETILSVGDPAFDKEQLPGLPELPESAKEAGDIASNYSSAKVLVNKSATKNAFRQWMVNADVIQFAGHYIVHPEAPLLSALVMAKVSDVQADNFFTNDELRQEKLPRTKLVVLSACQTGAEGYYNGEGLIGLSRTFIALGVPLVVASQWRVDSQVTAGLMRKFHRYRKQNNGMATVNALRKAQLEMVNAPSERFKSPYYWASFATFGGYAEF